MLVQWAGKPWLWIKRHNGWCFPIIMIRLAEPALKRRAACVWLCAKDTLTLTWLNLALRLLIKMTLAGNGPFGSASAVLSSLPSLPVLSHLACRELWTQLVSNHFIKGTLLQCPPRGRCCKQHSHEETRTLHRWLGQARKSLQSLCGLFMSPPPLHLIFLLPSEKGWIRMTFPLSGSTISDECSLNQHWELWSLFTVQRALNCVSSPQDAEGCIMEHGREVGDHAKESEQSIYSYLAANLRIEFRFRKYLNI